MNVTREDRELLRSLASRVAEIAHLPEQEKKRKLWIAHNSLEKVGPMIMSFPEGSWNELLPPESLRLTDPVLRGWECSLRQTIYAHQHIHDDEVVEPVFDIGWVNTFSGWGLDFHWIRPEGMKVSTWDPALKELTDIEKLRFPTTAVDEEQTHDLVATASDILGDLLNVRIRGLLWWSVGLANVAAMLRGLQQVMLDMYDNPGWLHELMSFLRDGTIHWIESLEAQGYLTLNSEADHVCSGGVFHTRELPAAGYVPGHVRLKDTWGFAEAQEFVGVSPQQFEEFALDYQLPILERFGLTCYGCCEPLHDKLHLLKRIPNLRRVSISPWADPVAAAEGLGDDYIFSYKPNPATLAAVKLDEAFIRRQLEEIIRIGRDSVLEIIMKDTHTVNGEPWRIERWTQIASEVRGKRWGQPKCAISQVR